MPKKFRSQILWSAAFAASAVLTYLFGVMLYVRVAGMFGPVSPESAELAASISSFFRPAAARPAAAATPTEAGTAADKPTLADTEITASAAKLPVSPALLSAMSDLETKPQKTAAPESVPAANAPMAANNLPAALPAKTPAQSEQKNMRKVLLYVRNPRARKVAVTGSFSDWKPKPLARKHNRWETELDLPPGRYEYSFLIDGASQSDPLQPLRGAKGSVLIVN